MKISKKISEIIRVDHAGEMGAKVIYDGQIFALKLKGDHQTLKIVEHMKTQEIEHFEYFNTEIQKQKIRPTLMQPVWQIGGFALGFLTAIIDKKSAMVCTTAVEETIDEHYQQQIKELEDEEKKLEDQDEQNRRNFSELKEKIEKFRNDEIEHRDTAYENQAKDFIAYKALSCAIKATTKFAIAVSKKI